MVGPGPGFLTARDAAAVSLLSKLVSTLLTYPLQLAQSRQRAGAQWRGTPKAGDSDGKSSIDGAEAHNDMKAAKSIHE